MEQTRKKRKKEREWGSVDVFWKGGVGVIPFLIKWLNWFNLVIPIIIIAISISIPDPVAVLGGILPPGCGTPSPARCPTLA